MKVVLTVAATLTTLASVASAADLVFWTGACQGSSVQCSNPQYGTCCTAGAPFCSTGDCVGCLDGNDLYGYNRASCTGSAYETCREPQCCLYLGSGNTCALNHFQGAARRKQRREVTMSGRGNSATDGTEQECLKIAYPDVMSFKDEAGESHKIFLDLGTHEHAYKLFADGNFQELKKFPQYGKNFPSQLPLTSIPFSMIPFSILCLSTCLRHSAMQHTDVSLLMVIFLILAVGQKHDYCRYEREQEEKNK